MRPGVKALPLTLAILSASLLGRAPAQERPAPQTGVPPSDEVRITVGNEFRSQFRLAFPATRSALGVSMAGAAEEIDSTVRQDLLNSRAFAIQGPEALSVIELTGDRTRDFELYRSLTNEILLQIDVLSEGDRVVVEGRVFDLASGDSLLGKRYKGERSAARRMAHTLADEIVLLFTGRRGVAATTLAFYSDRQASNEIKEIYLMDSDGRNQRAITAHRTVSLSPNWSPTGQAVAYTSYFSSRPGVYLVDLISGRKNPIVTEGSFNASPTFSPDGSQIAFARNATPGNIEIFIADRQGGNLRRITNSRGIDTNPAWSPAGRQIAFTSDRNGSPQIYTMDVEGTNVRRVSSSGRYNDGAAWSPDGKRIAYAQRAGIERFDIVVVDVITGEGRQLTTGPGSHETPTFSPDGLKIAFAAKYGSGVDATQIYVMDDDGSNVHRLTSEGNNFSPSWSGYVP
jgi:TolB protein